MNVSHPEAQRSAQRHNRYKGESYGAGAFWATFSREGPGGCMTLRNFIVPSGQAVRVIDWEEVVATVRPAFSDRRNTAMESGYRPTSLVPTFCFSGCIPLNEHLS